MYFRLENLPNKYICATAQLLQVLHNFFYSQAKKKVVLDALGAFSCTCICVPTERPANISFYSYACLGFFKGSEVS